MIFSRCFSPYQNFKLLIIKWYFPFLTSLALPLTAFPASIKDTMENLPIICIGLVQGFPSSMIYAHFYNQQYHTTTLLKISIYKVSKKEDSCCNPPLKWTCDRMEQIKCWIFQNIQCFKFLMDFIEVMASSSRIPFFTHPVQCIYNWISI